MKAKIEDNNHIEYESGIVAMIDFLGFGSFVSDENNLENVIKINDFIKKLCYVFNTSHLCAKLSFFSDTIVVATKYLAGVLPPLILFETEIEDEYGLLFRGGIASGKYYHEDNIMFGPAVIKAHEIETKACYSRIVVEEELAKSENDSLFFFEDFDGSLCVNPYFSIIYEKVKFGSGDKSEKYPNNKDLRDGIINSFIKRRKIIIDAINKNKKTPYIEKYLWRIRPFNYMCSLIGNHQSSKPLFEDNESFLVDDEFKKVIGSQVINQMDLK